MFPLLDSSNATDGSVVSSVVAAIVASIRDGRLVPGQHLVEPEIAQRFGASRSAVREAFQRLSGDGVLQIERHRGVRVRQLTRKEVENLFDVRIALEGLAGRQAVACLAKAPQSLVEIRTQLDEAEREGDLQRFSRLNERFHTTIVHAADNTLLANVLGKLWLSVFHLQFRILIDRKAVFQTNQEHHAIVDAILSRDADAAARAAQEHVERSRVLVRALPDEHFAADSATSPAVDIPTTSSDDIGRRFTQG